MVNLPLNNPELKLRPLFDEDIVLLLSVEHALAQSDHLQSGDLHIKDLEGVELILPAPHTGFREELDHAARNEGTSLRSKADIDGLRLLAFLTLQGYGLALLPATTLTDLPEGYKTMSVAGLPLRHVGIALRKRGRPSAPPPMPIGVLESVISAYVAGHSHLHEVTP